ncbi:MAG: dihydrolipoyllysine-residue acetyltransferase [Vulcanimicrobiaceae bacterium]
MATATREIRVPNIGDFKDVPIVDVLVKAGDTVRVEDPLVAIESEKATMEVPSPFEGVVERVDVRVGDIVSEGSMLIALRMAGAATDVADATATNAAGDGALAAPYPSPHDAASATVVSNNATSNGSAEQRVVELRVPDLGDFADIAVIDVLVAPGERIEKETSLVTLESEKAAMDVPSSDAGVIRDVVLKIGDRVSKGTLVATLLVDAAPTASQAPSAASVPPASHAPAAPAPAAASAPTPSAPAAPTPSASSAPAAPTPASYGASGDTAAPSPPSQLAAGNGVVHASPSIRRFARELGVDLHRVSGSGPHARITRDDVQNFVKTALAAPAAPAATPATHATGSPFGVPAWPVVDFAKFGPVESVKLSRVRKFSGPNLHRNWLAIPHVTNNDEADITDLEAFRKRVNAERPDAKVTMLAFVIKAVVVALRAHPEVNSSLDGDSLVLKKYYNVGFAADTPNGLMVPVLADADRKGIFEIATETGALAKKARDGKLGPAEMSGATFTISSLGGIGGTSFTPIINAPEVAILGVSRSAIRPVWDGTAFAPRLVLPLSLSYDHRVIDGALAARFNVTLAAALGDLRRALL